MNEQTNKKKIYNEINVYHIQAQNVFQSVKNFPLNYMYQVFHHSIHEDLHRLIAIDHRKPL